MKPTQNPNPNPHAGFQVRRLGAVSTAQIDQLSDVLIDCVAGGASVSFMHPLTPARARAFWRDVADAVAQGRRVLCVAEDAQGIAGTAQLLLDLPENQPHRGEIAKMLVHRRARGRGLGEALMREAVAAAREAGRRLLTLDTANPVAERLYQRLGWTRCGRVPGFALWPDGTPCDTAYYYLQLDASAA